MKKDDYQALIDRGMSVSEVARKCRVSRQAVSAALHDVGRSGKKPGRPPGRQYIVTGIARCYGCKKSKPVEEFHKAGKRGVNSLCKVCTSEKMARYQARKLVGKDGVIALERSITRIKRTLAAKEKLLAELNHSTRRK